MKKEARAYILSRLYQRGACPKQGAPAYTIAFQTIPKRAGERHYIKGPPVVGQGKSVPPDHNLVIGFAPPGCRQGWMSFKIAMKSETILDRDAIILYLN
jgi:hypothetical protein